MTAALPKAETHVHFLGAIDAPAGPTDRPGVSSPVRMSTDDFVREYFQRRAVIRTVDDIRRHACLYLERAHTLGVRHVEIMVALPLFPEFPIASVLGAFQESFHTASRRHGTSGGVVVDMIRDAGPEHAMRLLDKTARCDPGVVAGFGLGGAENSHPPSAFTQVFQSARALGYRTSVHVGEQVRGTILETLLALRPDRVEHATTVLEEPKATALLARNRTPVTVCLTSNERLGVVPPGAHPLRAMLEAGLNVSLHTDDPAIFGCDLVSEYCKAGREYGMDIPELRRLAANSFQSCFIGAGRCESTT